MVWCTASSMPRCCFRSALYWLEKMLYSFRGWQRSMRDSLVVHEKGNVVLDIAVKAALQSIDGDLGGICVIAAGQGVAQGKQMGIGAHIPAKDSVANLLVGHILPPFCRKIYLGYIISLGVVLGK